MIGPRTVCQTSVRGARIGCLFACALMMPIVVCAEPINDEAPAPMSPSVSHAPDHTFTFTYETTIPPQPDAEAPIDIYLPLATSDAHQTIHQRRINSSMKGVIEIDPTYSNHYWHGHLDHVGADAITITIEYLVTRRPILALADTSTEARAPQTRIDSSADGALFLRPNRLVPTGGLIVESILNRLDLSDDNSNTVNARILYDYVIDHMEYKKVGDGWGRGDAIWACTQQYGNCTDFHALFLSLARAVSIPARFEIGFPVPLEGDEGEIAGYHCWVSFLDDHGDWIPLDASEAWNNPEKRDAYFAAQPADRIRMTIGRDIEIGTKGDAEPLNYFVYPYAESAGSVITDIETSFHYKNVS